MPIDVTDYVIKQETIAKYSWNNTAEDTQK